MKRSVLWGLGLFTMAVMPLAESVTQFEALDVSESPMFGMFWM